MAKERHHPVGRSSTTSDGRSAGTNDASSRGRGASINPASRFETISLAQLPAGGGDDDLLFEYAADDPDADCTSREARSLPTRVFRDRTRTIINPVDSPDLPFAWTINPYRGCEHGCVYCYARPTHEMLGLSSGTDFETQIFAKLDAPALLRRELAKPSWTGEPIVMSGVTDAYQPAERRLGITRACLEVMAECCQPVSIVTKSALVTRDADHLSRLASRGAARVAISLTTLDPHLARIMEPRAGAPQRRLQAIRDLTSAGVPVVVMTAPIIPGINDRELPALLDAAAEAGAVAAAFTMLRLPWQNKAIFLDWLARHMPQRAGHIESHIRRMRGGRLNTSEFGRRFRGEGVYAEQILRTFRLFARRSGLDRPLIPLNSSAFARPAHRPPQAGLFD